MKGYDWFLSLTIEYRGTHGNLRLWRICKTNYKEGSIRRNKNHIALAMGSVNLECLLSLRKTLRTLFIKSHIGPTVTVFNYGGNYGLYNYFNLGSYRIWRSIIF